MVPVLQADSLTGSGSSVAYLLITASSQDTGDSSPSPLFALLSKTKALFCSYSFGQALAASGSLSPSHARTATTSSSQES